MWILDDRLTVMRADDNLTALVPSPHPSNLSPSVGTDLPLPAIISGVLVLAMLVTVIVSMVICSHHSPPHATFSLRHHQHELGTGLQAEDQITDTGYSSDNNAFDQTVRKGVDRTVSKSADRTVRKSFNNQDYYAIYNRERKPNYAACNGALIELLPTADNRLKNYTARRGSWTRRQSASRNRVYNEYCDNNHCHHIEDNESQADNCRTWLMVNAHHLDVIPEESDEMLPETSFSKDGDSSPNCQTTLDARRDVDTENGTQFQSCSEGEEVSVTEERNSIQMSTPYDQTHCEQEHENLNHSEQQETSQLICSEISRNSDMSLLNSTEALDSINEESSLLTVHSSFQSSFTETSFSRSLQAPPKPPRKTLPK